MSTVRIQVRRGTASDWTSVNPTLAAGEVGFESNTRKMKVGDGSTAWSSLDYISSDAPAIEEIAQDTIYNALIVGSGLSKSYDDVLNKITVNVDSSVVATLTGTQTLINKTLNSPVISSPTGILKSDVGLGNVDNTSDINKPVSTAQATAIGVVSDSIQNVAMDYVGSHTVGGDGITTSYNSTSNELTVSSNLFAENGVKTNTDNTGLITFSLEDNITISGDFTSDTLTTGSMSATDITATSLDLSGDLNVGGTTNTVNASTLSVEDPMIYMAADNATNVVDLGIVGSYTKDSVYQHTGLVRDASENTWKLFTGIAAEPTTTVNFAGAVYDNLLLGHIEATSANIGNVSNTELQYLDGVTSAIQTQIDTKLASSTASSTYAPLSGPSFTGTVTLPDTTSIGNVSSTEIGYLNGATDNLQDQINSKAPIANPTFTGTVSGITKTMIGLGDVDNTADMGKPVSTAAQAALNLKSDIESPTFTGTVVLPSTTSIGNVSNTEISYLDGVTSEIQGQLNNKATLTNLSDHASDTTSIHGIADTSVLATATTVATAKSEAITAAASAADTKVADAVAALTKSSVGLGNVDNTSDANKPVSTATQTALDLKAPKAAPTFTGTLTAADVTISGNLTVSGTTTTVNTTNFTTSDPVIYLGEGNNANLVDIGFVGSYNDGTYAHQGLVKDSSDGKWKLFKGVTDEPTTTVNFAQGSLDALKVGNFEATTITPSSGVVFSDGTQTKEGVPSRTPIVQKTTAYTLSALTERDSLIEVSSATAVTVTIPANSAVAYPVGTSIDILQTSTGQVTIAGAAGVTVNATPGLKLRTQWSGATLFKRATDTWVVYGDLSA